MKFKEFGNKHNETIIILHGGGLSAWSVEPIVNYLIDEFNIITPIIDGHGEDSCNNFISINNSAKNLIDYIDKNHSGKVKAICGLSIGAQIVIEILSLREQICEYSIIESALVKPMKNLVKLLRPMISLSYPLIKMKWYSKIQAKQLLLPIEMYDLYYDDSCKISKYSLKNILYSNSTFQINENINKNKSKALILVGEKEIKVMKESYNIILDSIPQSEGMVLTNHGHGELSQLHPEEYRNILIKFIGNN